MLESETLRGFYNLQALKFAGGMLRNVSDGAFEDLKNLKRFFLLKFKKCNNYLFNKQINDLKNKQNFIIQFLNFK